jgi:putative aldouronate transport system permease protein
MLLMRLGHVMSLGFEKVFNLYSPATYETADIISTFVYRQGILGANFSSAAAIGLFNSVINLILVVVMNKVSRKLTESSLW